MYSGVVPWSIMGANGGAFLIEESVELVEQSGAHIRCDVTGYRRIAVAVGMTVACQA